MGSDLKSKALKGFLWSGYQKAGSMTISFLANLILARLLTPSDFGCIGMILVFVNLSSVFIDAGFGSALIQRKDITETDFSTIFIWNIFIGSCLYGILYLLSPYIANFYGIQKLSSYLRVLGIVLIFNSFSLIQTTILKKKLEFKLLANCYIISSIIALVITIWMAYHNYNVWSLVVFQIVVSGINSILLWIFTKWRPNLRWSFSSFKKLFSFGGYLLASSIISMCSKQLQTLLIGKLCSTSTLGYYTQARNLEQAPTNVIYSVIGQVTYPLFSARQENLEYFNRLFLKVRNGVTFFILPLMSLLILIAKPLIITLFSEKWIDSVYYFQLLCITGSIIPLIDISVFAISALGHSKLILKWTLINNIICICMLLVGSLWSIDGIIFAYIIYAGIALLNYCILLKKVSGLTLLQQSKDYFFIFSICAVLCSITFLINYTTDASNIMIIISSIVFLSIYIGISLILKLSSAIEFIRVLKSIFIRFSKK